MSLLLNFEQQYSNLTAEITADLSRISQLSGVDRREKIADVERQLDEVNELLDQMELSIREIPSGGVERQKYENRLRSYKADRVQLAREFKKIRTRTGAAGARDDLFGMEGPSEDQTQMLIDSTETVERSGRKLDEGYRIAIETEQVGAQILNDLESQRTVLGRTQNRLRDADEDLGDSSKVLTRMVRRVIQNRAVLIGIVAFMLIIIGIVIFAVAKRS